MFPLYSPQSFSCCCVLLFFMRDTSGCWNLVFEGKGTFYPSDWRFFSVFGVCLGPAQIDILVEIDRLEAVDTHNRQTHRSKASNKKKKKHQGKREGRDFFCGIREGIETAFFFTHRPDLLNKRIDDKTKKTRRFSGRKLSGHSPSFRTQPGTQTCVTVIAIIFLPLLFFHTPSILPSSAGSSLWG